VRLETIRGNCGVKAKFSKRLRCHGFDKLNGEGNPRWINFEFRSIGSDTSVQNLLTKVLGPQSTLVSFQRVRQILKIFFTLQQDMEGLAENCK